MQLRDRQLFELAHSTFDTLVVGGGINGAVTAAALSARGAKVALIDARDFAGASSQQSSNLAWGGIKYMEALEFGLVRRLCASRNQLMRGYPSSVREIRFLAVHERGFRQPLWKIAAGTWLYWLMGAGFTRAPRWLGAARIGAEEPVVDTRGCDGGVEYSDAYLLENDARFVFQFVRSAMDHGCVAANHVASLGARRGGDGLWLLDAVDQASGQRFGIRARTLVNACGAFVDAHNAMTGQATAHRHVFSKGVHLVVDRLTPHEKVLSFFADDGRLFFAIPMGDKTCVGTTDEPVDTPLPQVTDEDRAFILDNINKRLRLASPLTLSDVVSERCGVRPLVAPAGGLGPSDWTRLSRGHVVEGDPAARHVSIFGGKLTDCINVGEELCAEIQKMGVRLAHPRRRWHGEPPAALRADFLAQCEAAGLDRLAPTASGEEQGVRLWRLYGAQGFALLDDIRADPRTAAILIEGSDHMACEFSHSARREMVVTLEDFLRRRSKIEQTLRQGALRQSRGLRTACRLLFGEAAQQQYDAYFRQSPGGDRPRPAPPPHLEPSIDVPVP